MKIVGTSLLIPFCESSVLLTIADPLKASTIPSLIAFDGSQSMDFRCYMIPDHQWDEPFIGRSAEIQQCKEFLTNKETSSKNESVLVISGAEGVGKTELAFRVVRACQDNFATVFWIDGRTEGSIRIHFVTLAEKLLQHHAKIIKNVFKTVDNEELLSAEYLGMTSLVNGRGQLLADADVQDSIVRAVKDWLSRTHENSWLLVFDNVGDLTSSEIQAFLPNTSSGRVLMTTQSNEYSVPCRKLLLDPLSEDEAQELLLAYIPKDERPLPYIRESRKYMEFVQLVFAK